MSAYDDLMEFTEGEIIEAVVFGGWNGYGPDGLDEIGYKEPNPAPVPREKMGVILPWSEAARYMNGWSLNTGFGFPETYSIYVWTDSNVVFVVQYDGATCVYKVPRNPINTWPEMPGG